MKICVIVSQWSTSGVPLAQRRLALALSARGHDVDLVVGWHDPATPIPATPEVNLIEWKAPGIRYIVVPMIRYLRRTRPDIVFSAEDHLNGAVLIAARLARSRARITASSRVPPKDSYSNRFFTKGWFRKLGMKIAMTRADALTCVSHDMVKSYRVFFPNGPHAAVYNIIDDSHSRARAAERVYHDWFLDKNLPIIVSAGTLTGRKNFRMLVDVVSELRDRGVNVRLAIFGEGYRRKELESQIANLKIEDRCWLPGRIDNPLAYFSRADVIALTSYAEGLPNVLVEGMICGCTPVATDCPTGPREVIEEAGIGYLVAMDDVAGMADAIEKALLCPAARLDLDRAVSPFREEDVINNHFALLGIEES